MAAPDFPHIFAAYFYHGKFAELLFCHIVNVADKGCQWFTSVYSIGGILKVVEHSNIKENEVQFTDKAIDKFLAFVDHMSCSADTYISLGGSNGCADQLTNWDGTQKVGFGAVLRKKAKRLLTIS